MIIRIRVSSGRDIYGFATENFYSGDWSLGPTWNYLVTSEKPFLLDTGRRGQGKKLLEMMRDVGMDGIGFVALSHGHEDHDGGLYEVVGATGAKIVAHKTYQTLIGTHPDRAPSASKRGFPASCWDCSMPASFYAKHCLRYHEERWLLQVGDIDELPAQLDEGISVMHVPGHSPDAVALRVDDEVVLVGDTILPDITPHPTREETFNFTRGLLPLEYSEADQLYGLRAYIRSLRRLGAINGGNAETLVLPAHRLFHKGAWKSFALQERVPELIEHHVQRCGDILAILAAGPKTAEDIAREHFEPKLLEGFGIDLAINEILSHCELLQLAGDVVSGPEGAMQRVGDDRFEPFVASLH